MRPRLCTFVVVAALSLSPLTVSAVLAQPLTFTHGAAEGGQVKTDDTTFEFPWPSNRFFVVQIPS